jgi:SAM-dependent methyltransferase
MSACLERFFAANRRLSTAVEARLPNLFKRHPHTLYKFEVAELINRRPGQVVVDVGGGKDCPFFPYVNEPHMQLIIGLDYSEEQLRENRNLNQKIVADAAAHGFPLRDGSADVVVSRSVVEHIRDNKAFFENCAHVLRPGGAMIHIFPGRFAPFALLNQLLPNWLARRVSGYLLPPEWVEEGNYGFPAFYNRCNFSAVQELLDRNGFINVKYSLSFYQSIYFEFFFPLFCVVLAYDLMAWGLGIRNLASTIMVMAERPLGNLGP